MLNPKQVAEYLQLSQRTIYRLLERGVIPAVKVGGQWRFRKAAVDAWLDESMQRLDTDSLRAFEDEFEQQDAPHSLAALLAVANARILVPVGLPASDRASVVRAFIAQIEFPEHVAEGVLQKEQFSTTTLGSGVALLHTSRSRPRLLASHNLLAVGQLRVPVDFGAIDESPTSILILVLARSDREQLALLGKLTRVCREPEFLTELHAARNADEVITLLRRTEDRVFVHAG
jgi:PTS system nitrogen regulatory IIA component